MESLVTWFTAFFNTFKEILGIEFDKSLLNVKNIKKYKQRQLKLNNNEELIKAVNESQYQKVQELLENGGNIEQSEVTSERKLAHIACFNDDLEMCLLLDKFNVNWESFDKDEQTPIFMAINAKSLRIIKFLVEEKKVNYEHLEYQNRNPFYLACFIGDISIVKYLFNLGVQLNTVSKLDRCALSKAAYLGHHQVVEFLLEQPDIIIDIIDSKGRTALHNAAWGPEGGRFGKQAAVGLKISINHKGKRYEGKKLPDSPISCELLLKKGHKVDFIDFDGITPLCSASSSDARESLDVLVKYGANVNHQTNQKETPSFLAAYYGHLHILQQLIDKYNADITIKDNRNYTILEIAYLEDNTDCYKYLLQKFLEKKIPISLDHIIQITYEYEKARFKKYDYKKDNIQYLFDQLNQNNIEIQINSQKSLELMFQMPDDYFLAFYQNLNKFFEPENYQIIIIDSLKKFNFKILKKIEEIQKKNYDCVLNEKIETQIIFNLVKNLIEEEFQNQKNSQQENSNNILQFLIFEVSTDILNFTDQQNNNIFHIFIEYRKTDLLDQIIQIIENQIVQKNKYFQKYTQKLLQQLFINQNKQKLSVVDLAFIKKYLDLYTYLNNFIVKVGDIQKNNVQQYYIPQYKIITENIQDNEFNHSKQEFIEQIISNNQNEHFKKFYQDPITQNEKQIFQNFQNYQNQVQNKQLLYIDNPNLLKEKIEEQIVKNSIFGIDLEYYTEQGNNNIGFICTLQISTVDIDIIIDCIKIHSEIKNILNDFFLNDQKIKIMHGGDNDLKWLKNNFDIDVFNYFDTNKAMLLIDTNNNQSYSLYQICKQFLKIKMDKSYQKADWRIRPLPQPMLDYAKNDSDVLVWLYPILIEQIVKNNKQDLMLINSFTMCFKKIIAKINNQLKIRLQLIEQK